MTRDARRMRMGIAAAAAIGVLLLRALGVLAYSQLSAPPSSQTPATACTPRPCINAQGVILFITKAEMNGPIVRFQINLTNHHGDSTHTQPEDFKLLVGANRVEHTPVNDAESCGSWPRTDVADGASFGPRTLCFRVDTGMAPLVLRWAPDLGFCCIETVDLSLDVSSPSPP